MMLPPLYVIVDAETLLRQSVSLRSYAEQLRGAGVSLVQYRDKLGGSQAVLAGAMALSEVFVGSGCRLVMNDRADLAVLAHFSGVHVGQGDLTAEDARLVVGAEGLVGVSTHNDEQVRLADASAANYVAIGPVFATGSKADAADVVGLGGVRRARTLTSKPLVAIGGITRENCAAVRAAGASSVAVISGMFAKGEGSEKIARDFLSILR